MIIVLKILTIFVSVFFLLTSFLPILPWQHWVFRATEYPGLQKFVASLLCALLLFVLYSNLPTVILLLIIALLVNSLLLLRKFIDYIPIPFVKPEVSNAKENDAPKLRLFVGNVLQDNNEYQSYIEQIKEANVDCFALLEVNQTWVDEVADFAKEFPYQLLEPIGNLYGMAFYSKYPIQNGKIEYLVKDDIPSMQCELEKEGTNHFIQIVHPQPPSPTESKYSTNKDKELMLVAERMEDMEQPRIVIGDFNDVAWSRTTRLFQKISRLLDPRKNRGFFSTFHAGFWFMRFPLDHIFVSKHYSLVEMKRLQANGSDHFPIMAEIACDFCADNIEPEQPDAEEEKQAQELMRDTPTND